MTITYYIKDNDDNIVFHDTDKQRLLNTLLFKPEIINPEILETEGVIHNGVIYTQEDYQTFEATQREQEFNKDFFNTSLGYIRRKVTMVDGSEKTFLTDLLPLMKAGIPILAYGKPDFTQNVTTESLVAVQNQVIVTEEFLQECQNQVIIDFYGFNPLENQKEV